ncbi:MAG TPA: aminodeoxychorismate synthase component I, partial [Gallionella sp.]|nr:aminodeoxychorismate synthase component I [Gallionella sp.]
MPALPHDQAMSFYCASLPYRPDASRYYAALADLPWAVWLDSGGMARYDILAAAPHRTLTLDEGTTQGDPFALLRSALGERVAPVADVPFAGGALGYWSYDLARRMMALPDIARANGQLPDMA